VIGRTLAWAVLALVPLAASAQQNPLSRYRVLSPPDCAGPAAIIAEDAANPVNATHMRVQHIGDPGTDELRLEVANEVTWDVGQVTGLHAPSFTQRGYRDAPPPAASSAFQLDCEAAGFFLDSSTFSHSQPLFGEGPSAGVGRVLEPAPAAFEDAGSTLFIQASIAVPTSRSPALTPGLGVTSVGFYYYVRDVTTGTVIAHVIGVQDNRPVGSGAPTADILSHDGITAFAGSPLTGSARFVEPGPGSATMRLAQTWAEPTLFRADIPHARFKAMLEALAASSLPGTSLSTDPLDYRVLFFGVIAEIIVGTDRAHEAALGGSVRGLMLARERAERRVGRFR
jgi:hypothetical protein